MKLLREPGLASSETAPFEVAIVGIGCRLPGGVGDPRQLAAFLRAHGDAVVEVPRERWNVDLYYDPDPSAPGKAYVKRGGFLQQDVFAFDPEPFGISPREADQLDPQQRLLLEVTWEAFEDAGIPIEALRGSNTGVFVGGFTLDYQTLAYSPHNQRLLSSHTSVGASMTLLSNRISYTFDLRGPSLTVDTACSSSLVATHLAHQAILRGDCDLALVGGVTLMLSPTTTIAMSKGHFLSPDGRSKTFDASADGYGRGEGAAVIALKRLDLALRDRDRIYAVLRATGISQDGRTDGIPMPSEAAQRELGKRVLEASGLSTNDVQYVEAHGTGTRAGDLAETSALGSVYERDRNGPLLIGSVKSNIGHLEAAAGVTGLIKAALSVQLREIFPLRALENPNPEIAFERLKLQPAVRSQAWPTAGRAVAAVNSFGYGGTNANAIVCEPPAMAETAAEADTVVRPRLVPISAATGAALAAHAGQLAGSVDTANWLDQAYTLARRRAHLPERAVLVAASADELAAELRELAQGQPSARQVLGRASAERKLLWIFTGMGPQWWAMGQELLECEPEFRRAAEAADAAFQRAAGWSILREMRQPEAASRMRSNAIAQPANFVIQVGLTSLLRALGVPSHGLLGHSVGELAAAWAAGCLSLEQAAYVAYHRSRLQQTVAGQGTMLATSLSEVEARRLLAGRPDVSIAALNAPKSVTLAGAHAALEGLAAELTSRGLFNRMMPVEVAYHSVQMEPLEAGFHEALHGLAPQAPELPLYSTAYGARVGSAVHDAGYWWHNARQPVLLQSALAAAIGDGYSAFLEIGPHPVLAAAIREVLADLGSDGKTFHCLKRREPEQLTVLKSAAELHANGVTLDWSAQYPAGRFIDLPKYPFQRERHFLETSAARAARLGPPSRTGFFSSIELGPSARFSSDLARPALHYLNDHRIKGAVVFAAAAYIDAALCAARELRPDSRQHVISELRFERALVIRKEATPALMLDIQPGDGSFGVFARHEDQAWSRHGSGCLLAEAHYASGPALDVAALARELDPTLEIADVYARLSSLGLDYGPEFQRLETLQIGRSEGCATRLLARLRTSGLDAAIGSLHPTLLDAAFHGVLAAVDGLSRAMVPVSIERVRWFESAQLPAFAHASWSRSADNVIADVTLAAEDGSVVLEVRGLSCRFLEQTSDADGVVQPNWMHVDTWQAHDWPAPAQARGQVWALAGTATSYLATLADALAVIGIETRPLAATKAFEPYSKAVLAFAPDANDPAGIEACAELQHSVGQLLAARCSLRLITFGAHRLADTDAVHPSQSALVGLARVIMTEHPELSARIVDLPAFGLAPKPELLALLDAEQGEEESAVRGDAVYARRLRRHDPGYLQFGTDPETGAGLPLRRNKPAAEQLEVELLATALDEEEREGESKARRPRSRSLVGRVVRIGSEVQGVAVDDLVQFVKRSELTSHVLVAQQCVLPVPATLPVTDAVHIADLVLAWHIVHDMARIAAGDCVLVHDAARGVGLACVQVARSASARVIAAVRAGDPHDALLALGVAAVCSFDTLEFSEEVRACAKDGIQTVINTLLEPVRSKSISLLEPGGCFVDVRAELDHDERLELRRLRGIRYSLVERDAVLEDAGRYRRAGQQVLAALDAGKLAWPTPALAWPAARALRAAPLAALFRADRTYLVTGGLSGFGLATAEWLVDQGAAHVVLASRRGEPGAESVPALARMRQAGAEVACVRLDVSDEGSIAAVLAQIDREMPKLAGIFHSAMVLDDRPLRSLDRAALARVMAPKALGALLLYRATAGAELDYFVLYSSVSSLIGNPNQASYAAANAFLDGLAALAASERRTATCISWGALGDVGVVARDAATEAHLAQLGIRAIPARLALEAMGQVLRAGHSHAGVIDMQWDRWVRSLPRTAWNRLTELAGAEEGGAAGDSIERLHSELSALDTDSRRARVRDSVRAAASSVLRIRGDRVDDAASLRGYGIDSLMAIELQSTLERTLGVSVPSIELLAGVSIDDLTRRALLAIEQPARSRPRTSLTPDTGDLREQLLARICVQPPYFALNDLDRDGDWVVAHTVPLAPGPGEAGPISSAEAARHLAIVGSCAVSLQSPIPGKIYYPVMRAHYPELARTDSIGAGSEQPLASIQVRGRCVHFDARGSQARAETELLDDAGRVIVRLTVDYHVIPELQFAQLFAAHAMQTNEAEGGDPYAQWQALGRCEVYGDGELATSLGPVDPAQCLGHFVGYPALPVSVMMRSAVQLVAAGVQRMPGMAGARVELASGFAETHSFVFAHERATLTARRLDPDSPGTRQEWRCEVEGMRGLAAVFDLTVDVRSEAVADPSLRATALLTGS